VAIKDAIQGIASSAGTAEDRLVGTLESVIRKARTEQQQEGADMIDLAFQFVSPEVGTPLTATIPAVGLRVDFPCRLVSAHVSEMSNPSIAGSATVRFYYRNEGAVGWTDISDGTAVSMSGAVHGGVDITDGWFRYLEPGQEVTGQLFSVATCESVTGTLKARKLPVSVSGIASLRTSDGDSLVTSGGDTVGFPRG
jgi:hypothetical protein